MQEVVRKSLIEHGLKSSDSSKVLMQDVVELLRILRMPPRLRSKHVVGKTGAALSPDLNDTDAGIPFKLAADLGMEPSYQAENGWLAKVLNKAFHVWNNSFHACASCSVFAAICHGWLKTDSFTFG